MSRHHSLIKNDPRWKAARLACFERDDFACVACGITADQLADLGVGGLEADHVVRLVDAPDLAFELDNLQTLCGPCHDEKERDYDAGRHEHIRLNWISPKYPELHSVIETTEYETEANPIL